MVDGALTDDSNVNGELEKDAWEILLPSILNNRDAHTLKVFRVLYHASRVYKTLPTSFTAAIASPTQDGKLNIKNLDKVDFSLWLRSAIVLVEVMGWNTSGVYGERVLRGEYDHSGGGKWDRSGLGWAEAWM